MDLRIAFCVMLFCVGGSAMSWKQRIADALIVTRVGPCNPGPNQVSGGFIEEDMYGKWYEIARTRNPYQLGHTCSTMEMEEADNAFAPDGVDFKMIQTGYINKARKGQLRQEIAIPTWGKDISGPTGSIYLVQVPNNLAGKESALTVIGTDYTNYTAATVCLTEEDGSFHTEINWIWTRSPNPSKETVQTALQVFVDKGYDISEFSETYRVACPDSYYGEGSSILDRILRKINFPALVGELIDLIVPS